jgi:hypothetical protein
MVHGAIDSATVGIKATNGNVIDGDKACESQHEAEVPKA